MKRITIELDDETTAMIDRVAEANTGGDVSREDMTRALVVRGLHDEPGAWRK